MPWVDVSEPHAKPPRVHRTVGGAHWTPPLSVDRGWGELDGVSVDGESGFDPADCQELTIGDSSLSDSSTTSRCSSSATGGAVPPTFST